MFVNLIQTLKQFFPKIGVAVKKPIVEQKEPPGGSSFIKNQNEITLKFEFCS